MRCNLDQTELHHQRVPNQSELIRIKDDTIKCMQSEMRGQYSKLDH